MMLQNTVETEPRLAAVLADAADGRALRDAEARALAGAGEGAVPAMREAASRMRDLGKGRTVSLDIKYLASYKARV